MMFLILAASAALFLIWSLWPRKVERKIPEYWAAGDGELQRYRFTPYHIQLDVGRRHMWVYEPERAEDTVLMLAGFAHRGGHMVNIATSLRESDKVIIPDLNGVMADRPRNVGRISSEQKRTEVIAFVRKLWQTGQIRGQLVIVGHSLGATFESELAAEFPELVGNTVLLAPVPMQRYGIARHLLYWVYALGAVPSAIRALVWGSGMLPPKWVARGLFTNGSMSREEFDAYYAGLVPDSALAFLELMFVYCGIGAHKRARDAGWLGSTTIIAAGEDRICRLEELKGMAKIIGGNLRVLPDLPHCFFLRPLSAQTRDVLLRALD